MNMLSGLKVDQNDHQPPPRQLDTDETRRLRRRIETDTQCEILFSQFDRGRYATDASHYQIFPIGVVTPERTK